MLDIEGTTTPIDFVHKRLFPYAFEKIGEYLEQNFDAMQTTLEQLREEHKKDVERGLNVPLLHETSRENAIESLTNYLHFLIEADRKSTPLKSLQGKIWQKGYEAGELVSEVFDDVLPAFERWQIEGKTIAIYSSGSILAQKLLFKYTTRGDLTPFIFAYFDTVNAGHKREAESYRKISSSLGFPHVEILFLSDVVEELDAAHAAGLRVKLVIRPKNLPIKKNIVYDAVESFQTI